MKRTSIVVVDNGACTIKAGLARLVQDPRVIPNAVIRSKGDKTTYFGHEFYKCRDHSSLHYRLPFEKGYLVDWDAQKAIWDGMFSEDVLAIDTSESSLLITEPYFNLPNIQEVYDQFVFEEYDFQSYYRCTPASLVPRGRLFSSVPHPECVLIVDSGFSFTHIVPIMDGAVLWYAVKRIDVGGKLLTNQLKELASFRQWNMMDETYIVNEVKETCCYVSNQFSADLEICRTNPKHNPILQEYVLPDFSTNRRGHVRKPDEMASETDQVLYMGNERFSVPEILFRPDDIGMGQSGVAMTIAHSIALLPEDLQGMFWANIGLIGGNAKFPGFAPRLLSELRSLAPVDCEVVIYESENPILEAYRSAMAFANQPAYSDRIVTKAEYQEGGSNACRRKFRDWKNAGKEKDGLKNTGKGKERIRAEAENPAPSQTSKAVRTRTRTVSTAKRR
ncbi:hypothetical protein HETIRDRAFT_318154 [Heterobasidion irregulare TC 32-1]|uniref:Actin-like protein ARP6 n=1 Tax=Heterobasidion irregulare (strain TC 32-1) TaxID=747525 RepID=W4K7Z0_HETIT|nr:uncharacterized protein HETIRDRAFT_318154 [Heterobasidion irregulare TC 32-1]ETW81470.1 hypothetical protein HETIRDRAFT_318154 [Heterobasidion irregulare TC 32-1]